MIFSRIYLFKILFILFFGLATFYAYADSHDTEQNIIDKAKEINKKIKEKQATQNINNEAEPLPLNDPFVGDGSLDGGGGVKIIADTEDDKNSDSVLDEIKLVSRKKKERKKRMAHEKWWSRNGQSQEHAHRALSSSLRGGKFSAASVSSVVRTSLVRVRKCPIRDFLFLHFLSSVFDFWSVDGGFELFFEFLLSRSLSVTIFSSASLSEFPSLFILAFAMESCVLVSVSSALVSESADSNCS